MKKHLTTFNYENTQAQQYPHLPSNLRQQYAALPPLMPVGRRGRSSVPAPHPAPAPVSVSANFIL
jgi:hypothetical protein